MLRIRAGSIKLLRTSAGELAHPLIRLPDRVRDLSDSGRVADQTDLLAGRPERLRQGIPGGIAHRDDQRVTGERGAEAVHRLVLLILRFQKRLPVLQLQKGCARILPHPRRLSSPRTGQPVPGSKPLPIAEMSRIETSRSLWSARAWMVSSRSAR